LPSDQHPKVIAAPTLLPDAVHYDPEKQELRFGDGRIGQVPVEVADYSVGDMNIIRKWFEYRLEKPQHAGPSSAPDVTRSPLDAERALEWDHGSPTTLSTYCTSSERSSV